MGGLQQRRTTATPVTRPVSSSVPIVHAVTSAALLADADFAPRAAAVMRALGPRGAVHLRGADLPARRLLVLLEALAPVQAESGGWVIVNDRLDVALAGGARGAQLTSRSLTPADARQVAPALPLGASVHDLAEALAAERAGASWVVAGNVYPTASHPGARGRGIAFLRALAAGLRIPVVAIGGVTPATVPLLRAAGAHGVAAIRGIWGASDADRAATDYLQAYDAHAPDHRDADAHGERRPPGSA